MNSTLNQPSIEDREILVQPLILILSALLVPVLLVAFFMLYALPDVGLDYFAWPVTPLMSSMMLAATYLGGAYFFSAVLISRRWRHVWLGFCPLLFSPARWALLHCCTGIALSMIAGPFKFGRCSISPYLSFCRS
jgi:hypothetical protein